MSNAKITPQFHYSIAKSVFDDIATNTGHYNYFVSDTTPWTDLANVPVYSVSVSSETDIRSNMVSTKKVNISDVSFVVPDNQWASGEIFDMYDDVVDMSTKKFYAISNNRIYKCLDNNGGVASVTRPTGTELFNISTSEGYIWKYMADIPPGFINKFAGSGMMPITRQIHNPYYSAGNILNENVTIVTAGTAYDNQSYLVIDGDGTGADGTGTATATATLDSNGSVTDITITDAGKGYTYANLTIVKGANDPGSGATFEISVGNYGNLDTNQAVVEAAAVDGSISTIIIENGGSGYDIPGNVTATVVGDGTAGAISLTITNGVITDLIIDNYGSGYNYATISITDSSLQKGSGASLRVIISPRGGHGYDLPRELKSTTLCLFNSLDEDKNHGIIVNNDYNQIGLIKGIEQYGVTSKFSGAIGTTCYLIDASSISPSVIINTVIYMGTKTFRVISYDGSKVLLQAIQHSTNPSGTLFLDSDATNTALTVTSILFSPTINKYSGDIILAENRITFSVTGDINSGNQGVKFKSYISF
jgi:hypothetical protein